MTITMLAIVRNLKSKVLFTQFVGRAIRKPKDHQEPPAIAAVVVSHEHYKQRKMYESFDQVADVEDEDENE